MFYEDFDRRQTEFLNNFNEASKDQVQQCVNDMSLYLNNIYSPYHQQLWFYTMHGINDASAEEMKYC